MERDEPDNVELGQCLDRDRLGRALRLVFSLTQFSIDGILTPDDVNYISRMCIALSPSDVQNLVVVIGNSPQGDTTNRRCEAFDRPIK